LKRFEAGLRLTIGDFAPYHLLLQVGLIGLQLPDGGIELALAQIRELPEERLDP
jgi:hypothetical protein